MDRSLFLSKVLGIYLFIIGLAMFLNMDQFSSYVNSLINDAPLMFVTGFFTLILGILMVVSHTIWQWNWRLIVTLISWITFLKGVTLIFYPVGINQSAQIFFQNSTEAYIVAGVDLILGIVLLYFGFRKN